MADAQTLEQGSPLAAGKSDDIASSPQADAHMPSVTATDEIAAHIRSGGAVNLPEFSRASR